MKKALVLAVVLAATPVMAQPVTRPDACGVNIAYAPGDVRILVEAWVHAESHCDKTLEVRIVPTDGGLYLFARDERGMVRERIVPDAQAAAVLVTSWLADDSKPPPPPPMPWPPRVPPADFTVDPFDKGPEVTQQASPAGASKWIALGALVIDGGRGLRAELDAYAWGRWTLGVGGSIAGSESIAVQGSSTNGYYEYPMSTFDARAVVYLTRKITAGKWYVRPSLAAGFTYSSVEVEIMYGTDPWNPERTMITGDGVLPTAEATFLLGRTIGKSWAIDAGPMWSVLGNGPRNENLAVMRGTERAFFASARYRL